jgi:hypothetical protein
MAESTMKSSPIFVSEIAPTGGWTVGQVLQIADGRAGVVTGTHSPGAGQMTALQVGGQRTLTKTASVVVLDGDPMYWDRSANTATPLRALAGADFPIGVAVGDHAGAGSTVVVDLNTCPVYTIDALADPGTTVVVLTAGAPALTVHPGYLKLAMDTTTEAQKVDLLSDNSVPLTIPFIVEGRITIADNGDDTALDINVGIANATHATSADTITESCFLHFDGNDLKINAESDDGTTEVAATDTTVAHVEDTYFDFRMDCRDLTDIQMYVDGINVLPASVFKLDAATGPMKLLAHIEKTSNNTPGELRIQHLAIRTTDIT